MILQDLNVEDRVSEEVLLEGNNESFSFIQNFIYEVTTKTKAKNTLNKKKEEVLTEESFFS